MQLDRSYAVRLYGLPVPQGDLSCYGQNGRHHLVHSNKATLKPWRELVELAGSRFGVHDVTGPVGVEVTFTIARPASAPLHKRPWPAVRCGDVDKLARAVLDGLSPHKPAYGSRVLSDDSIVVQLVANKTYPDSPGMPDRLDRPGAVIRIYPIGE